MKKTNYLLVPLILSSCFLLVNSKSYNISFSNLAQVETGKSTYDFMIVDDIIYAIDTGHDTPEGLVLINITYPSNPQILDSFFEGGIPCYVTVVDDYAYIANWETGIDIIDVSDPTNITKIGSYYDGGTSYEIRVINDIAYVADGSQGFEILNVSDPTNPSKINQYSSFYCSGLSINNNKAYLIDRREVYSGLLILDVTDPNNIQVLGTHYESSLKMVFPTVYDGIMFVGNHYQKTGEIRIYNISNPADVTLISSFKGDGRTFNMELVNDVLFLASLTGLEVINLADITEPSLIGSYIDAGIGYDISVREDIIFFSAREEGIGIYQYSLEEIPEKTEGFAFYYVFSAITIIYIIRRKFNVRIK